MSVVITPEQRKIWLRSARNIQGCVALLVVRDNHDDEVFPVFLLRDRRHHLEHYRKPGYCILEHLPIMALMD